MYEYIAMRCQQCGEFTAIMLLREYQEVPARPFSVTCAHCEAVQPLGGYPVSVIQVEQPIENLPDLSKFPVSDTHRF